MRCQINSQFSVCLDNHIFDSGPVYDRIILPFSQGGKLSGFEELVKNTAPFGAEAHGTCVKT